MTDIAARTAVCQAYLDGLVAGDLNAVLSLFADDATVEDPVGTEPKVGREALAAFYQMACDFVTAAQLTGTPRVAGNEVAFPFEITLVVATTPRLLALSTRFALMKRVRSSACVRGGAMTTSAQPEYLRSRPPRSLKSGSQASTVGIPPS